MRCWFIGRLVNARDMVIKSIKYDQNIPAFQFDRFDDELSSWLIGYACVDWNV